MAFQAGLLNMGGFLACHRFVSHVTGFATFFGNEVSQGNMKAALGMLIVPLFFLFGAMLSGQLVDIRLKTGKKPKYYIAFGVVFFLTVVVSIGGILGCFGKFGEPLSSIHGYVLLVLLCLICGVQNGTITTVSKSVIRTSHLTGITTDLGIGLVRLLNHRKLNDHVTNERKASVMRLGIILFFGMGSVAGGFIFSRFGHEGFLVPVATSGVLFFVMMYFQIWREPRVHQTKL